MADGLSDTHAEPAQPPALVSPRPPRAPIMLRRRFGLAYLLLAAVLGAAVGLFVVFAGNGGKSSADWSAWVPMKGGTQRLDEIGKHVSEQYGLASGSRLVGVLSAPPHVQSNDQAIPVQAIIVRSGLLGETENDLDIVPAGDAWTYVLCGFGESCAISEGAASVERGQLLRREALELALYTFKYVAGIESVVAFMPPPPGEQPRATMYFRRDDLKSALDRPLAETLPPPPTRLTPGKLSSRDLSAIRRYTDSRAFNFEFQQTQLGGAILVLSPLV